MGRKMKQPDTGFGVVEAPKQVKSWPEWFQMSGHLTAWFMRYEEALQNYALFQYPRKNGENYEMNKCLTSRHETAFYEKDPAFPGWKIRQLILKTILTLLGCTALLFVLLFLAGRVIPWKGQKLYDILLKQAGNIPAAVFVLLVSAGIGLLIALLVGGLGFLAVTMKRKSLCKQFRELEEYMRDKVQYLPPKYRNSEASGSFYNCYINYGVTTFSSAVDTYDGWAYENSVMGDLAVMSDIPYDTGSFVESGAMRQDARAMFVENSEAANDPNLPDDIGRKIYAGPEDAEIQLANLIGLDTVKKQIAQMKNRMEFYGSSGNSNISGNHMVFLGPPGTGKTTIARIVTRILYDFGYIQQNKIIEVEGSYLKSPYVGQTSSRVEAIINYAKGGVLFIDEAYLLLDAEKSGASTEATGILLKAMEDCKSELVVILAGYESDVNKLISSNEGFASRIKYKVYFDNYSAKELVAIFNSMLENVSAEGREYKIGKTALTTLEKHFEKERKIKGFGNARVVRNALDSILDVHADRFMRGEIPSEQKFLITKEDVDAYLVVREKQMQEDGRNFASQIGDPTVISLAELKSKTKDGSRNPDKDLEALVGLENVKEEIRQMKTQFEFYHGQLPNEGCHMVFFGPPGTGKTTVAGIMTAYLYQMGYIAENRYLDINGDFLRGMYVGHTGKRTEAVVQYAQGMVLFVDEAYLLKSSGGSNDFGAEAVGVLLDAMEKYRKDFVVIFAGYEAEMNEFLGMNSGLESRISQKFHFESYSPKQLCQMMQKMARKDKFKVDAEVWKPLQLYLREQRKNPRFGNARFMRQFWDAAKKQHISNYAAGKLNEALKYTITVPDVEPLLVMENGNED